MNCVLAAPSTYPLLKSDTQKKERGGKEGVCKHLQVAAHQCMQSFSSQPVLPSQSKN